MSHFAIILAEVQFMAKAVDRYISEPLEAYQDITQKTYTGMALDLDITLSNLYRYRNGTGNPRAKAIDKIVSGVERNCPEALRRVNRYGTESHANIDL